jgi:hypothetical protein
MWATAMAGSEVGHAPWFFSMRAAQTGHFLVLTRIQLAVSDSLPHLSTHASTCSLTRPHA